MRYKAPRPDPHLISSLRTLVLQMERVQAQYPSIGPDDLVNIITFSEGRLGQAATMIASLDRQRTPPVDLVRPRKR